MTSVVFVDKLIIEYSAKEELDDPVRAIAESMY